MGYYTNFEIEAIDDPKSQIMSLLQSLAGISGYRELESGYASSIKWYDCVENCKKASLYYPELLFRVTGDGENSDDIWRLYVRNGKTKLLTMIWPEFNIEELC